MRAKVMEENRQRVARSYEGMYGTADQASLVRELTDEYEGLRLCDMDFVEV